MPYLSDEEIGEIVQRASRGESFRAIGRALDRDESVVRRAVKRSQGHVQRGNPDNLSHEAEQQDEIKVIRADFSHLDHLYLYPLGDIHKGASMHQSERWGQWLNYLCESPNTAMMNTGDNLNAAIVGSKSDVYEEAMTVGKAKWQLINELKPLAATGRLINIGRGNHEDRIWRATGDDPCYDMAEVLGVPYVREAALFDITVGDINYKGYMRHGTGNGQSVAGLEKSILVIEADFYVTAHTHRQVVTASDRFYYENGRIVRKHRYFVSSGSFLAAEPYAVARGYTPSRIGAPRIYLDGQRHQIHASI